MEETNEEYIGNRLAGETLDKRSKKTIKYLEDAVSHNLWNLEITQVYEARLLAQTWGGGVNVAIIDTGVNYNHPQLRDSFKGGVNLMSSRSKEDLADVDGHGSFVAGIIAGKDIGITPKAGLYSIKVSEREVYDPRLIINALEWCIQNKIDIVNISSGTPTYIESVHYACKKAEESGLIVVASAGNNCTGALFPASYDESVVSVGAIDSSYKHRGFSNIWPTIDIVAPGENIFSAYSNEVMRERYSVSRGTSAAAPHITGILTVGLSLLKRSRGEIDTKRLVEILKDTALSYLDEQHSEEALSLAETYSQHYDPKKVYMRRDRNTVKAIYGAGLVQAKEFIGQLMKAEGGQNKSIK